MLVPARPLVAQPCDGVALRFEGAWDPDARRAIRAELATALAARDVQVCAEGGSLAEVRLARGEDEVGVTVEVSDALTRKRLERVLALGDIPADSRALALAIAADELLLASWAELALAQRAAEREQAPPAVRETVAAAVAPPPTPRGSPAVVELGATVAVYGRGTPLAGGLLGFEIPLHRALALGLRLVADAGGARRSDAGAIRPLRFGGGVTLAWLALGRPDEGGHLGAEVAALASLLRLESSPAEGVAGSDADRFSLVVRGGAVGGGVLGPLRIRLRAGVGAVLTGARGTDPGRQRLVGPAGVEGWAELAFGVVVR